MEASSESFSDYNYECEEQTLSILGIKIFWDTVVFSWLVYLKKLLAPCFNLLLLYPINTISQENPFPDSLVYASLGET